MSHAEIGIIVLLLAAIGQLAEMRSSLGGELRRHGGRLRRLEAHVGLSSSPEKGSSLKTLLLPLLAAIVVLGGCVDQYGREASAGDIARSVAQEVASEAAAAAIAGWQQDHPPEPGMSRGEAAVTGGATAGAGALALILAKLLVNNIAARRRRREDETERIER